MSTTDKIRKLLRLAEAGTLHEAEAAARQAQAMIVRHRLTLEDVGDIWGEHDSDQKVEAGPAPGALARNSAAFAHGHEAAGISGVCASRGWWIGASPAARPSPVIRIGSYDLCFNMFSTGSCRSFATLPMARLPLITWKS